jgi:hypothetical protein
MKWYAKRLKSHKPSLLRKLLERLIVAQLVKKSPAFQIYCLK